MKRITTLVILAALLIGMLSCASMKRRDKGAIIGAGHQVSRVSLLDYGEITNAICPESEAMKDHFVLQASYISKENAKLQAGV